MAQILLQEVPQEIRDWFGSENTVEFLIDLNEKLGIDLDGDAARIIPHLLYRLETKDIDPLHFADQIAYWLQLPKEQADSVALEIKDKLLNPIREQLNKISTNISLIDVTRAKPFADTLPQIHVNPRPSTPQYLAHNEKLAGASATSPQHLKDKLTLVEEKLVQDTRQKIEERPTIKINKTLLGLQRTSPNNESVMNKRIHEPSPTQDGEKPFMLFGEETKAAQSARPTGKGFSVPFGFFNKNRSALRQAQGINESNLQTREGNGILGAIKRPSFAQGFGGARSETKEMDYSAERAATTPFAKEEEVFRIKDSKEISNSKFLISNDDDDKKTTAIEKMFQEPVKPANGKKDAPAATPKPILETPPAEGSVSIKTNPFLFPKKSDNPVNGKPKVEGNTIHL